MAYFKEQIPLQLLAEGLEEQFNKNGWETWLKYRAVAPSKGGKTRKFARVYLFKSLGTDSCWRNFGFIQSYGGKTPVPFGEEELITHNSVLGILDKDSVNSKMFHFKVYPILTSYLKVYVNGLEINMSNIDDIDADNGTITFAAAYSLPANAVVTATYGLADDVPDIPSKYMFFTCEDVITERFISNESLTLDAGVYKFPTWVESIKPNALEVYDDGVLVDSSNYDPVIWDNPQVKFKVSYTVNGLVTVNFVMPLTMGEDEKDNEIIVKDFDVDNGKSVYEAVLSTMRFVFPSLPTTITFIDEYTAAWTRESEMFVWGNATKNRVVMFYRVDPSPDAPKAYYAPLYIGKVITFGKSPKINNVIIGGSNVVDEVKSSTVIKLSPSKILDYGPYATNGNDGVQLQQTVGGTFYQRHYLSFITHDDKADVSPESRYNPSVYSGKYHISQIYVVHPNDGYVGILDEVYAIHPKNIAQMDELEVIESVDYEPIGIGDGENKVFHLTHTPKPGTDVTIQVDCASIPFTRIETVGYDDNDEQLKAVTLNTAPDDGKTVYASYQYAQTYIYTLATVPRCPFVLEGVTPYAPIGLGILKKNEPFE